MIRKKILHAAIILMIALPATTTQSFYGPGREFAATAADSCIFIAGDCPDDPPPAMLRSN